MRIPIRLKLAFALALPVAGLVAGAAFVAIEADGVASEANDETGLAAAAVGPASVVSQLQNERDFTSIDLIGQSDVVRLPVTSIEQARTATDAALADLRTFVAQRGPVAEAAFADGLAAVEAGLEAVRARNDEYDRPRTLANNVMGDEVFDAYAGIVDALLDGTAGLAYQIDDAELRTGVELVDLTTRLYELRSRTIRRAIASTLADDTSLQARLAVAGALAEADAMELTIRQLAVGPYEGLPVSALGDAISVNQDGLLDGYALNGTLDVPTLLLSVDSTQSHGVLLLRRHAAETLLEEASGVLASAEERRSQVLALSGAAVVIALAMIWMVSRSITQPLRSLTQQAEAMAGATLPAAVQRVLDTPLGEDVAMPDIEPIVVATRDEVREVAAALNVVQQSALDLAVEQAVLRRNIADSFVNLGRRNQNLLDRQLDFITDLENEESDPDALASLFRLDHLATRMRRNAESLLRLAGSEPQRRWSVPIELADVVRGALGEVEDFQRVQIRALDQVSVPAAVGADLAHALAELIENALSFSPPTEPVEVRGRRTAEGYVLAVADNGLGMTVDELIVANRRLAGDESFTVAPSRYLGHYVAGHLASRLGMRIELSPGPAGGIVARVDIPPALLVEATEWRADEPQPAQAHEPAREREPVAVAAPTVAAAAVPEPAHEAGTPFSNPFTSPASLLAPTAPGFGGLAVTLPNSTNGSSTDDGFGTTASGLVRRVPGAQHPVTDIGGRAPTDSAPDDSPTPDSVSSLLSDFSAGVARGIDEAGRNPWDDEA